VALESGTLIQPPPAPGTAANYAHTLRLILRHVAGDPTEDRIVVAALRSYGRLRSPREAWSAFRLYAGERGLDLPEYPYSRIAAERTKRQPTRRASTRIDPTHFAPADVVRGIYDLFGDRKVAYQGIAHLRRSDVKEEGGQYLLPERWSDGGWMRWRPLNASERLGLRVVLAWGMVEDRTGEDDPLVPVAPGSPTPATSALVLRALAHHGYTIGRR
jgi:hypothetical protein